MLQSTILLALASTSLASFAGNLNYRSPSHNHPALGISIPKVLKRSDPLVEYSVDNLEFTHGIASGDPYPNSVILWTRCAPSTDNVNESVASEGGGQLYDSVPIYGDSESNAPVSKAPVCVEYNVSPGKGFNQIADRGTVYTSSDIDFTVKVREKLLSLALVGKAGCDAEPDSTSHQVEASHLKPFTTYYYKFNVCGSEKSSPIGRAKTSPTEYDEVTDISLAVYSCSNFVNGYFNAYGNTARKDSVDYVVHLGDYIYELGGDGSSIGRKIYPQKTIYTLYEYRKRHATHKTDEDLLLSHQTFTWIPVWDDHGSSIFTMTTMVSFSLTSWPEVADNTYRDGSSLLRNIEGSFIVDGGVSVDQRKMNAVRAYFEWMPIRQVAMDDNLRIWRNFKIGNLLDLIMLDTRHYDRSITDLYLNSGYIRQIADDIGRSMMGPRQEYWFYESLKSSAKRQATWRVIGSQTVFSRVDELGSIGLGVNVDSWDGYRSNLNRTLKTLYENNIGNNIVIAGDSHAKWYLNSLLDEYHNDPARVRGTSMLIAVQQELQWSELYYRGYFELTLSHTRTDAKFFAIPDIKKRSPLEISMANFTVIAGENRLSRTNGSPSTNGQGVHNGALKKWEDSETNCPV
ncbi:alkaline phosphatase [Histoplasma capsulatum H143]|uniref:Alkaline phosphatase n=1 Tax=Ajellomyces capsulatus (strain H143) TaxID=544712 RepID=C6HRX1_AJECH|nr:alkaline phosphatase [Histoplasma capsulatum H143]